MYMSFRQLTADPARLQDAVGFLSWVRDRINSEHGGSFGVAMNVGGNPSALSLASPWATLGAYEKAREGIMGDVELQSAIRMAAGIFTGSQDTIAQILKVPGPRKKWANVTTAAMNMATVADTIGFALEVAEFVESKTGNSVGVLTAFTGNRSGLMWIGYGDSLDEVAENSQKLETDPDYLAFFPRSEPLFMPGTLEQNLWQLL
jgi:hypothetical protein